MSDALNYLEKTSNQINTMITNPTSLTYGCIGVSTILLAYYTFFKSDGEKSESNEVSESAVEESEQVVEEPVAEEPVAEEPVAEESQEEQTGGKSRKKSTKKQKHKNKNKKTSTRRRRRWSSFLNNYSLYNPPAY